MARAPKQIEVDFATLRGIVEAARHRQLIDEEHAVLEGMLETVLWLERELQKGRLDAKRLYRMLFGPHSEKTADIFPSTTEEGGSEASEPPGSDPPERDGDDDDEGDSDSGSDDEEKGGDTKGHGRRPADDYRGANKICVEHESLKSGQRCPACARGKVYAYRPRVVVRVSGAAPLTATLYEMQRLRCNLCGEIFTARPPPDARRPKYDETAAAMIALLRYGSGLPHNRLGKLQASLGIPLPPSTQWDVVDKAELGAPAAAYDELMRQAAGGELVHNDDTKMPVLALTGKRRSEEAPPDDPDDRTGMFTTSIISKLDGRRIALFMTGRRHAGENLTKLLGLREPALGPPLQMCDGLDRNLPHELATIVANCMSHARRKFVDVADNFPSECLHLLQELSKVFQNDKHCRNEAMMPDERLAFHKAHSLPVMNALKLWCQAQLDERRVEPNSGLGDAIKYMLKRWDRLTLFCRRAGAPLDNNICERALKRAIVHRKNSYFYRSLRGARVGDVYMSLIHTAELCGADPFDYLVALLRHADAVEAAPAEWMPWCYVATRDNLASDAAA